MLLFAVETARLWLLCYITLLSIYLLGGLAIQAYNQRIPQRRIQRKACKAEQIRDDFWQSLRSIAVIALLLALGLSLRAEGFGVAPMALTWWTVLMWGLISLLVFDTWFYWLHRLLHHRHLYRRIHRWHHRATTPTVWSNNSDTFLDNLFLQSYWLVAPLVLPIPSVVLIAHKLYDHVTGMLGHAGYEYAPGTFSRAPSPLIGTLFHDQHHAFFHYNYATHFSIWDRLMGTVHPEYDQQIMQLGQTTSAPENPS